jgi:hypothetical protein
MTDTPHLAARIRAVHANPAEKLDDLLIIAAMVERLERQQDEQFQTARWQDAAIEASDTVYRWKATR